MTLLRAATEGAMSRTNLWSEQKRAEGRALHRLETPAGLQVTISR
jgi:hypothetical protein